MPTVQAPQVWVIEPDPNKTFEQNLQGMFEFIQRTVAQSPEKFTLQLTVPVDPEMTMDAKEIEAMIKQGMADAEAMEKRELLPQGVDEKDGQMLYKLKG
jgi:hypothetical protein